MPSRNRNNNDALERRQFSVLSFVFQTVFITLIALFGRYKNMVGDGVIGGLNDRNTTENTPTYKPKFSVHGKYDYPIFQDIHVMVIVGFGFLLSFLKRYGFSAISVNLLLSSFVVQYVILLRGFLSREFVETGFFTISINELIVADLSCVTVLITMGVLLGKLTPVQFLVLAFIETSISLLLEHVLFNILHVNDGGRSLMVHCFGAYFGLVSSKVCRTRNVNFGSNGPELEILDTNSSIITNNSELFSMIGTLFLWIFFPSFNAAAYNWEGGMRQRAILNTYLAIVACTIVTFMASSMTDDFGRFNIVHVQSSTLAGGISIGSVANVVLYPHHAMLVGALAGVVSVLGHSKITPKILEKKFSIHDACGIHNLHGLPGLLAGIFSVFFVLYYNMEEYGSPDELRMVYSHMIFDFSDQDNGSVLSDYDRDRWAQAAYQLTGLVATLTLAILGGMFSGWIMNFSVLSQVPLQPSYEDTNYYLHAEYSLFGKLENGVVIEEYDSAMFGEANQVHAAISPPMEIKAVY